MRAAGGLCQCWHLGSTHGSSVILHSGVAGKVYVPKKRVDPIIESVTLEPELEEALASATDAELCDIAGNTVPYIVTNLQMSPLFHKLELYLCLCIIKLLIFSPQNVYISLGPMVNPHYSSFSGTNP